MVLEMRCKLDGAGKKTSECEVLKIQRNRPKSESISSLSTHFNTKSCFVILAERGREEVSFEDREIEVTEPTPLELVGRTIFPVESVNSSIVSTFPLPEDETSSKEGEARSICESLKNKLSMRDSRMLLRGDNVVEGEEDVK